MMGIMTRLLKLCKADIHGAMDQLEDKALLLKQYLREMESSLRLKESRLHQLMQSIQKMQRDLGLRREEINKLEKDLELSLRKKMDDIAKLLIRKKKARKSGCEQLQRHLEILKEEKDQLRQLVHEQRCRYDQLRMKAAAYFRQVEQHRFQETDTEFGDSAGFYATDEEEIELELIRRKEAIRQGGDT